MPYRVINSSHSVTAKVSSKAFARKCADTILSALATTSQDPATRPGGARVGWQVGPVSVKDCVMALPTAAKSVAVEGALPRAAANF